MGYKVAVVGATGNVGREILSILAEREFPMDEVAAVASSRSQGNEIEMGDTGKMLKVRNIEHFDFAGWDIALFAAGSGPTKEYAPKAAAAGCVVIDNSSLYRMDPDVPLIVPEVNPEAIAGYKARNIIANPNCSTIQMVVALKPLHDAAGIKRVVVTTFQAVSGSGYKAVRELEEQVKAYVQGSTMVNSVYPHPIAFNVLPHIDQFDETGYTAEEWKMVNETKKIIDPKIEVTATTVRVPVFRGHSEAVNIETERKLTPGEARDLLSKAPGVVIVDDPAGNAYPLPILTEGRDETFVGRIRADFTVQNGLNLWIVADNLIEGAAGNAVQIAEYLVEKSLLSCA